MTDYQFHLITNIDGYYISSAWKNPSQQSDQSHQYMIAYHGTDDQSAKKIKSNGFIPSQSGRMGPGVYFALDYDIAKKIAFRTGQKRNRNPAVLTCKFPKTYSSTFCLFFTTIKDTYKEGTHPKWDGVTKTQFQQVVVGSSNAKKIKVLNIQYYKLRQRQVKKGQSNPIFILIIAFILLILSVGK